jgi:hypothetical protein
MVALFRQALEPAYPWPRYLDGYQKLMDVFNIESSFGRECKRVLVVTGEPLSENLAGPAIRALEISKFLVQDFDVLLATTKGNSLKHDTVSTISTRHRKLNLLVDWADIVIFHLCIRASKKSLVRTTCSRRKSQSLYLRCIF